MPSVIKQAKENAWGRSEILNKIDANWYDLKYDWEKWIIRRKCLMPAESFKKCKTSEMWKRLHKRTKDCKRKSEQRIKENVGM